MLHEERLAAAYARALRARIRLVNSLDHGETPDFLDDEGVEEPLAPEVMASLARLREELKSRLFAPNPATRPGWKSLPPGN